MHIVTHIPLLRPGWLATAESRTCLFLSVPLCIGMQPRPFGYALEQQSCLTVAGTATNPKIFTLLSFTENTFSDLWLRLVVLKLHPTSESSEGAVKNTDCQVLPLESLV